MNDLPTCPRRTAPQALERVPSGAVVTIADAHPAVALNETALALWELCDGQTTVEEMAAAVTVLFALDPAQARTDVESALRDMQAAGVIV